MHHMEYKTQMINFYLSLTREVERLKIESLPFCTCSVAARAAIFIVAALFEKNHKKCEYFLTPRFLLEMMS